MEENIEKENSLNLENENINSLNDGQDDETVEEKIVKLDETNKKLFARAKKAEEELKALKISSGDKKPQVIVEQKVESKNEDVLSDIDKKLEEKLEERELESMEISDNLKKELMLYAKAGGLKIKQAVKSDYFNFLKEKEDAKKKAEDASIGGKRGTPTHKDFSSMSVNDFDLKTEEGRKQYEEYKKIRSEKK